MAQDGLPTRLLLLRLLRQRGDQTAHQLSSTLGLTAVGVRRHLRCLEQAGMLLRRARRNGRGRPTWLYRLTPSADAAFPNSYQPLVASLLEDARQLFGDQSIRALMERRAERLRAAYAPRVQVPALVQRLSNLSELLEDTGYMPTWSPHADEPGAFILTEHNCPIFQVAGDNPETCACELNLYRDLLQADVTRLEHRLAGHRCCSYLVRLREAAEPAFPAAANVNEPGRHGGLGVQAP